MTTELYKEINRLHTTTLYIYVYYLKYDRFPPYLPAFLYVKNADLLKRFKESLFETMTTKKIPWRAFMKELYTRDFTSFYLRPERKKKYYYFLTHGVWPPPSVDLSKVHAGSVAQMVQRAMKQYPNWHTFHLTMDKKISHMNA